jgi:hypothetical protein
MNILSWSITSVAYDFEMHEEPRYLKSEDVSMRLDGSIVKYKGVYKYAVYESEGTNIGLYDFSKKQLNSKSIIDANDPELDISSVDIGYVNIDSYDMAAYVTRLPYRKQKQGTSAQNTKYQFCGDSEWFNFGNHDFAIISPDVYRALVGGYPDLAKAVKSRKNSVAISRDFAIKNSTEVYFQNALIGTLEKLDVKLDGRYNDSVMIMKLAGIGVGVY